MSRTRQVYLVIGLAGLAMLGLVALQVYWIQSALVTNEKRFNSQVAQALSATNQQIEKRETLFRSQLEPQSAEMPADTINVDTAQAKEKLERRIKKKLSNLKRKKGINKDSLKNLLQPLKGLVDSGQKGKGSLNNTAINIQFEDSSIATPALKDSVRKAISQGFAKVFKGFNVFKSLVGDLKQAGENQRKSLEIDMLDSLLNQHLQSRGIKADYYMGVLLAPDSNNFLYKPEAAQDSMLASSPHGTALFGSNIFTKSYQLKVYFPEKGWALFNRIKWIMVSSVLFLGLLIGSFIWISKHFFRQKQLSEIKTDFINNMTHELKTPISTISLATEALQDQELSADHDQRDRFTQMINDENKRLSNQVERVLQMAKLEKGTFNLKTEEVAFLPLLERVVDNFQFRVEEQGGTLNYEAQINEAHLEGDEVHLTNVFQNLLDNAIKYTNGAPTINVRVGRYLRYLRVEVADQGIGMTNDEQKNIFDKFYRVSNGNVHNVQGFGLGLSYVATIVKAHAGFIRVSSSKGRGTTFYLYLPLATEYSVVQ